MTRREMLATLLGVVAPGGVCWLKLDLLHNSQTSDWRDLSRPISFGSLLKPFLLLAFAATHAKFPTILCRGARDRCWLAKGHGEQDVVSALANSCNCYFLRLGSEIDRATLDTVCLSYGLELPARSSDSASLIGLGAGWLNKPADVARAFSRLNDATVLRGMEQCALRGTAKNLHLACYAKTGTAPCSHSPHAPGDGFVSVLYPLVQPRTVFLLEHHGTTGAETCRDVHSRIDL